MQAINFSSKKFGSMKKIMKIIALILTMIYFFIHFKGILSNNKIQAYTSTVIMYVRCVDSNGNFLKNDAYYGIYRVGTQIENVTAPRISSYIPAVASKSVISTLSPNNVITFTYNIKLPILEYHCIADPLVNDKNSYLYVSVENFKQQMEYLRNNGYTPISFRELPYYRKYKKPIIITFDDGYKDNYINAYPILQKNNIKATIFLISNRIDQPNYLSRIEIQQMLTTNLISFQSHTVNHLDLKTLNNKDLTYQLTKSKQDIKNLTSSDVNVLDYPYGAYSDNIIKLINDNNYYQYCVINGNRSYIYNENKFNNYMIPRIIINRNDDLVAFISHINQ